jgi:Tfp pilus assembly protein PilO
MIVAVSEWPEAAIAIAGILMVTVVVAVAIWQVFATGRTGLSAKRENAYRKLAEESAEAQRRTAEQLEKATAELAQLRRQTSELERVLKEVE